MIQTKNQIYTSKAIHFYRIPILPIGQNLRLHIINLLRTYDCIAHSCGNFEQSKVKVTTIYARMVEPM